MPTGIRISQEVREQIMSDLATGHMNYEEIGKKYNLSKNPIGNIARMIKKNTPATKVGKGRPAAKRALLRPKIMALKEQGYTPSEMAAKLGIKKSAVGYYLYHKGNGKLPNLNGGDTSNGHFNRNVALGIAYAETERFIGVLSQRLGFAPNVLRLRLSELLGHSPMRGTPGAGD